MAVRRPVQGPAVDDDGGLLFGVSRSVPLAFAAVAGYTALASAALIGLVGIAVDVASPLVPERAARLALLALGILAGGVTTASTLAGLRRRIAARV